MKILFFNNFLNFRFVSPYEDASFYFISVLYLHLISFPTFRFFFLVPMIQATEDLGKSKLGR